MLTRGFSPHLARRTNPWALLQNTLLPFPRSPDGVFTQLFTSKTYFLMKPIIVSVPSMGDSITEGTIVSWTVAIGKPVKEGDVVCLVETDKVTVDIKAQMDGIITAHFGKEEDTVTVGEKLYAIDSDISRSHVSDISNKVESVMKEPESLSADSTSNPARVPSIKFLGKQGWASRKTVDALSIHVPDDESSKILTSTTPASLPTPQPSITKPHHAITVHGGVIRSSYGRGRISSQEIESLLMGGASSVDNILPTKNKKKRE